MVTPIYNTFSEAYMATLADVFNNPDFSVNITDPEAGKGKRFNEASLIEKLSYKFTIKEPKETDLYPITKSEKRNKVIKDYIDKETILFDEGNNNSDGKMSKISKVWDIISNEDGTINSNYGLMVYHTKDAGNLKHQPEQGFMSQWEWAKNRLIARESTGQAILHFNRPNHQWTNNRDQPCTVFIQFIIRNKKLHLFGYMRSNDLIYGTPYNISYFIRLMHRMIAELKSTYPDLTIGNYTHNATSLHIYTRNFDKAKAMLGLIKD
jgi:thymidylate synthase